MDYVLRLSEPDEQPLQLFTDEEEFTAYLSGLIEEAHYSGTGPLISGIWSWDEKDIRRELILVQARETREEEDWLYWEYAVKASLNSPPVLEFTVRIDGRA